MKIILLKDVGGVGKRKEVKDVSDGYAINFLIPRGLAHQATAENVAKLEREKRDDNVRVAREDDAWKTTIESLQAQPPTVSVRVNDRGHPYQHIAGNTIERAITETYKVTIPKGAVILDEPITDVGQHIVLIRLGTHEARIPIVVKAL